MAAKAKFGDALREKLKSLAPGAAMRKTWEGVKAGRVARLQHRGKKKKGRTDGPVHAKA